MIPKSQSQINSDKSPHHHKIHQHQSNSDSSSSDEDSSRLSVHITSRLNDIKKQSSSLRHFQQQMQVLIRQNEDLKQQNAKLIDLIKNNRNDRSLKKQLKEREKQIADLRRQMAEESYYESNRNTRKQSAIKVDIEERKYKLNGKSIKNVKKRQSSVSSISDSTGSVKLFVFDKQIELKRVKAQKLSIQTQFYELREKFLTIQQQLKWMNNLSQKLVSFAQKLSCVFKQRIFEPKWRLLKKAKVSWRYLKHILYYILEIK